MAIEGKIIKLMADLLPFLNKSLLEAGCDEAGRGCLAGPVVAAAVILPKDYKNPLLNDSKQLTEKQRDLLRPEIEREALAWAVEMVSNEEIDHINILNASFLAMNKAVQKLTLRPEHLLVDGNRFRPQTDIPFTCIVKGDGKFLPIAAASVLAKTWRDELMKQLHTKCPEYNWQKNKGYPTLEHREALQKYGISPYHRKSFRLFEEQLELDF